jgi:hypothetical protein
MFHCTALIHIVPSPKLLFNIWLVISYTIRETDGFNFIKAKININRTKYLKTNDLSTSFEMA